MLANKNPDAIVAPLQASVASLQVVDVPGSASHQVQAFGTSAQPSPDVASALAALPNDNLPVLIAGSLYLAGEVLRANDEIPD